MRVGRVPVSAHLVQRHREDVWLFLNTIDASDRSRRAKLSWWYYDDPLTLMYHVNKGLYILRTDETRAQMSYSSVTQKMTLHMTANTLFTVPYHSATASTLGFCRPVASDPEAVTSSPVVDIDSDSSYPFHVEAPSTSRPTKR